MAATTHRPFTLEEHGAEMPPAWFAATRRAAAWIADRACTVSAGSWFDPHTGRACVFSIEDAGLATYSHPRLSVSLQLVKGGCAIDAHGGRFGFLFRVWLDEHAE